MDELMELALKDKWDEVIAILQTKSPVLCDEFLHKFIIEHNNGEYPYKKWTEEQRIELKRLDSAEYRTNYYMSKDEDDLTDDELADLRACDF